MKQRKSITDMSGISDNRLTPRRLSMDVKRKKTEMRARMEAETLAIRDGGDVNVLTKNLTIKL